MHKTTEYILKEQERWKHLEKITIKEAIDLINQKTDKEISTIVDFSKAEIKAIINGFNIKENETLVCEIQGGSKLTEREKEFFTLIKQGKNISEISKTLMAHRARVKTVVKIIFAKILIGLYKMLDIKEVNDWSHPVLDGMRYYGFMYGKAAGRIGDFWYEFDEKGKVYLKIKCDSFERIDENHIIVSIDKKYGLADNSGNYLITPKYEELKDTFGQSSYLTAKLNGKYGIIDKTGKIIIDFKYDELRFLNENLLAARIDTKEGIIDINENIIVPFKYRFKSDGCLDKDGTIPARKTFERKNKIQMKWGLINLQNEVLVDFKYDILMPFWDRKYTLAIVDKRWMYVNKKGEILKIDIENYDTN